MQNQSHYDPLFCNPKFLRQGSIPSGFRTCESLRLHGLGIQVLKFPHPHGPMFELLTPPWWEKMKLLGVAIELAYWFQVEFRISIESTVTVKNPKTL